MLALFLSVFLILSMVTGNIFQSERYLIDSRPILFMKEKENDSRVVNSTLVIKKKGNSGGPVYYTDTKPKDIINNHHIDAEGVIWKRPYRPASEVFSNHKGPVNWNRRKATTAATTTKTAYATTTTTTTTQRPIAAIMHPSKRLPVKELIVNNHNPSSPVRSRPLRPTSLITVVQPPTIPPTELLGGRIKPPDTITSSTIQVLDAPSHVKTKIIHNKLIVIQKRLDQLPITTTGIKQTSVPTTTFPTTIFQTTESPDMGNFSVAPVMDIWSNIPIPSTPAWATAQSKPAAQTKPVKGANARPTTALQSPVIPHIPFMGFITQVLTPLLSKPLSTTAVNSGMQGIKAMQGFLRNSLLGAMFCFLPSAVIALSLTATQRAQLRKIPEIDEMMLFCKTCLENLKKIRELAKEDDLSWMNEA